jgi:hypothetical protein
MSYRKLNIDGTIYQYTIGRKFVKIRGGEVIPVDKIGWPIAGRDDFMVTPGTIKEYLTTGGVYQGPCKCANTQCGGIVTKLRVLPYEAAIQSRTIYKFLCDNCLAANADDI